MPKSLLWTESGDIATTAEGAYRVIGGVDAVHNQIYWLLRQAAAGYRSGFNIHNYAGRTLTPDRSRALKLELEDYLRSNVTDLHGVIVSVLRSLTGAVALSIQASSLDGTGRSSELKYDHGTWSYTLPEPQAPPVTPADAPNNLLDR